MLCYCRTGKDDVDCPDVDCPAVVAMVVAAVTAVAVLLRPRQVGDAAVVGEAEPYEGQVQPGEGRVVPRGLRVARPQVVVVHVEVGCVRRGAHLREEGFLGFATCD